jgi:hypothetical protein
MRSRMPSGSRCHFAVFFDLVKIAAYHSTHADVARVTGFENEDALSAVVASEAKQSILPQAKLDSFVAEPVIGRAFARPVGSSQLLHSNDE